ncbi:AMP-binding enzyme [Caballeronia sordidicola]|uniref:AMP-binding enzyme n=1 Tax=Caballeronia sordidicola TaxID=196367 RepID=UPI00117777BF
MEHPEIADASVRLMRPDEGVRLKAFVVPRDPSGIAELRTSLEAWLRDRLTSLELPKAITFGASLPKNGMGKCMDWIIARIDRGRSTCPV